MLITEILNRTVRRPGEPIPERGRSIDYRWSTEVRAKRLNWKRTSLIIEGLENRIHALRRALEDREEAYSELEERYYMLEHDFKLLENKGFEATKAHGGLKE